MEDLLAALFSALAEALFELLFELFAEAIVSLIVRAIRSLFSSVGPLSPILAGALYLFLGGAFGALSIFFFPHPIFRPSRFHGISLLVSPLITGLVMSQVGKLLRRNDKEPVQIESFGYGFTFALGMAVVRLILVR